jgi:hypothetical protein
MPIKTLKLLLIPLLLFWGCDCRQSVSGAVVDKQTNHPLDSAAVYKLNKPYDELFQIRVGSLRLVAYLVDYWMSTNDCNSI